MTLWEPPPNPLGIPWAWADIGTAMYQRRAQLGLSQNMAVQLIGWAARSTLGDRENGYRSITLELFTQWCTGMKVIADIEIVDGAVNVILIERRKGHGLERNAQNTR